MLRIVRMKRPIFMLAIAFCMLAVALLVPGGALAQPCCQDCGTVESCGGDQTCITAVQGCLSWCNPDCCYSWCTDVGMCNDPTTNCGGCAMCGGL